MRILGKEVESCIKEDEGFVSIRDVSKIFGLKRIKEDEWGYHISRYVREKYTPLGDYLSFSKLAVENWPIVEFDEAGIPINNFRWGKYYYPITIAHYGLQVYGKSLLRLHNSPVRYMGDSGSAKVKMMGDSVLLEVCGKVSDGFELKNVCIEKLDEVKITSNEDFRVYLDVVAGEAIKKICIYNGQGKYDNKSEVLYLSLFDGEVPPFLEKLSSYQPITELKVRGKASITFPASKLVKPDSGLSDEAIKVANWFVQHQDERGAWPSNFEHHFFKARTQPMANGWPSALAQGLGISFLSRMYHLTKNDAYKVASEKALSIFHLDVEEGGIRRRWLGSKVFFEEYPTNPPSYVLNGFMFSILGLYDCWKILGNSAAKSLFSESFSTLLDILPLYDLGDRSAYDLTHVTCKSHPNVARWGYHQTHINQLYALETIVDSAQVESFRKRWERYMDEGYSCPMN